MELCDRAYVDLEAPAHITLDGDRLGSFQFGAVAGWIDYRLGTRDGKVSVEFSWEGRNDADPTCGRGWAAIDDDRVIGYRSSGWSATVPDPTSGGGMPPLQLSERTPNRELECVT